MKKKILCLAIMLIMIAFTFGAGCIDNVNSKTAINSIGNIDIIPDDLKKANEVKEYLNKYLKIIENPPSEYSIRKEPVTSFDWRKNHISVGVYTAGNYYIGYWADAFVETVIYVDNGVSLNAETYFLKSETATDSYCITVAIPLSENTLPHDMINIFYLTPSDYDQFIIDLYNHM